MLTTQDEARTHATFPADDPIPGYRRVRRLGRGGWAEVWEAEGPGGVRVALKIVNLGDGRTAGELRALDVMRGVRHPGLLPIFGAWQVEDRLVIGMDLADRSLWDRFHEAQSEGLRGVPRAELLGYLDAVARAVDYLNDYRHTVDGRTRFGIQHRDLKPQNILLFGDHARVADFGLARVMEQGVVSHTGTCTIAYAAPEVFGKRTSRQSDQYALAVTYCQLRGGRAPFYGTPAEVAVGHLLNEPDLTSLPDLERPVVARALAKRPDERWPDCRSFVAALRALEEGASGVVPDRLSADGSGPAAGEEGAGTAPWPSFADSDFAPPGAAESNGPTDVFGPRLGATGQAPTRAKLGTAYLVERVAATPASTPAPAAAPEPEPEPEAARAEPEPEPEPEAAEPASEWAEEDAWAFDEGDEVFRPKRRLVRYSAPAAAVLFLGVWFSRDLLRPASWVGLTAAQAQPGAADKAPRAPRPLAAPASAARVSQVLLPGTVPAREAPAVREVRGVALLAPVADVVAEELGPLGPAPEAFPLVSGSLGAFDGVEPGEVPVALVGPASPALAALGAAVGPLGRGAPAPRPDGAVLKASAVAMTKDGGDEVGTPDRAKPAPLPTGAGGGGADLERAAAAAATAGAVGATALVVGRAPVEGVEAAPPPALADYERGRAALNRGAYSEAVAAFGAALREKPDSFAARRDRGIAYHFVKRYREALADYAEAVRLRFEDPLCHLLKARAHHELDENAEAVAEYSASVRLRPDPETLLARGLVHHDLGNYGEATADFDAVLKLRPDDHAARFSRGLTRYHSGDYAGAVDDFTEALRLAPRFASAYRYRGDAFARLGDASRAGDDHDAFRRLVRPGVGNGKRRAGGTVATISAASGRALPVKAAPARAQ